MTLRLARDLAERPELMRPPAVLVPPVVVEGRVVLMTMPPKGGKSTTGAALLVAASRAGIPSALLTLDEAMADSLQRLVRFGADLNYLFLDDTFTPDALEHELEDADIRVLVVDYLGKLAEMSGEFGAGSQGDSILWGRLVSPFAALAREHGIAVVLLDQARRSDGAWSGAAGKGAGVDIIAEMHPKDGGLVCTPRGRIALPPFRVDLGDDGVPVFSDHDGRSLAAGRGDRIGEGDTLRVLEALADAEPEGLRSKAWQDLVAERCNIGRSSFFKIRKTLFTQGLVSYASRVYHVTPTGERALAKAAA